jgi:hypothetical protein
MKRRILISLASLATSLGILIASPAWPFRNSLRASLSQEGCKHACWRGIEPGVTDQATTVAILDEADIDYFLVALDYQDAAMLERISIGKTIEDANGSILFENDKVVWLFFRVWDAKLPVSKILRKYGPPTAIEPSRFLYAEEHLEFDYGCADGTAYISRIQLIDEREAGWFLSGPNTRYWEEIAGGFPTCTDNSQP